jgi:hypothetical protein
MVFSRCKYPNIWYNYMGRYREYGNLEPQLSNLKHNNADGGGQTRRPPYFQSA